MTISTMSDLKFKQKPDFGGEVGGFVEHAMGSGGREHWRINAWTIGMLPMFFIIATMPRMIVNSARRFAVPSRSGYVSNIVSKLPKQF